LQHLRFSLQPPLLAAEFVRHMARYVLALAVLASLVSSLALAQTINPDPTIANPLIDFTGLGPARGVCGSYDGDQLKASVSATFNSATPDAFSLTRPTTTQEYYETCGSSGASNCNNVNVVPARGGTAVTLCNDYATAAGITLTTAQCTK
jgi:hypothetical protein